MFKVLGCLTQEHDYWMVAVAAVVCLSGCALTLWLFGRSRGATTGGRLMQFMLTGVIGGATIWTTHFVAMLAYNPGVENAYEPVMTAASLFVAIVGVTLACALAAQSQASALIESGGILLGLSVAAMHYLGMSAYQVPGRIEWDLTLVIASLILGAGLGALTMTCAARSQTRLGKRCSLLWMTVAICAMHFTAMGAVTVVLDPSVPAPTKLLADETLSIMVLAVMSLFLIVGLAAVLIEEKIEEQAERNFRHATLHDPLTSLPNRVYLQQELDRHAEKLEEREDARLAILTLDFNRFKEINDMHGHAAGDAILVAVARRFRAAIGENEFIARTGGDEFAAIKTDYSRLAEVRAFAERLRAQVADPVRVGDAELVVDVSVGIAAFPEHGETLAELLRNSDLAMYRAKQDEVGKICNFDESVDRRNRARLELTKDLRVALDENQFELRYQVQHNLKSRQPVGFEALLRWRHPVRGWIPPVEFVPIAEETGLIRSIGIWVLRTACFEAASWSKPLRIAVNVAPQQLVQPSFVEHVSDILMETGLDPTRLELEITEASIIDDQKNALEVMHRLKSMGIRIAMDDFGTGYSSLATLRGFPFDKIKIDRSFVGKVDEQAQSAAIVRSTLLLGGALNIPVLAEGVEREEELEFLGAETCAEVQGFFLGEPMPADDVQRFMSGAEADAAGDAQVA